MIRKAVIIINLIIFSIVLLNCDVSADEIDIINFSGDGGEQDQDDQAGYKVDDSNLPESSEEEEDYEYIDVEKQFKEENEQEDNEQNDQEDNEQNDQEDNEQNDQENNSESVNETSKYDPADLDELESDVHELNLSVIKLTISIWVLSGLYMGSKLIRGIFND